MSEKNRVNYLFWFLHTLIYIYMRLLGGLRLRGKHKIPRDGGLIIASNHIAAADPFLLGSAIPRELWFMAKKELFKPFLLGRFIAKVNAFPVDRFGFDIEVIKKSISLLKQGRALIMFPEGTRSKDGRIMEGKIGVGMLAYKAGVPIVPAYVANTKRAWWNLFKGKRMKVNFGDVIEADWIKSLPGSKEGYRQITDLLMERIRELQGD
ncbi:MAG: 1-acyl-sn-glycerol-3-phosphate acyltransferase [candidate division Zixibacteria bacterium]|nr:1-acyl-sn-glycerol-3-phosphate acyltransferase [candidate division Zixibacteria bacterium]